MGIRLLFGHTAEELTQAQWAVVDAFRRALDLGLSHPEARRTLREVLTRVHCSNPEQWAAEVAEALIGTIAQLQAAVVQVQALTAERDRWRDLAAQAERRAQSLEQALARARQTHQAEVARLQEKIAALNRIIVEQQEELNARNA